MAIEILPFYFILVVGYILNESLASSENVIYYSGNKLNSEIALNSRGKLGYLIT